MSQIFSVVRNGHQQKKFRDKLKVEYNSTCPISDSKNLNNLEAAHIIPFNECASINPNIAFTPYNGILMNKQIHRKEFEPYKFTFDIMNYKYISDSHIEIPIILADHSLHLTISQYKNKRIKLPASCLYCLRYHYKEFLKKNKKSYSDINCLYLKDIHKIDVSGAYDADNDALFIDVV